MGEGYKQTLGSLIEELTDARSGHPKLQKPWVKQLASVERIAHTSIQELQGEDPCDPFESEREKMKAVAEAILAYQDIKERQDVTRKVRQAVFTKVLESLTELKELYLVHAKGNDKGGNKDFGTTQLETCTVPLLLQVKKARLTGGGHIILSDDTKEIAIVYNDQMQGTLPQGFDFSIFKKNDALLLFFIKSTVNRVEGKTVGKIKFGCGTNVQYQGTVISQKLPKWSFSFEPRKVMDFITNLSEHQRIARQEEGFARRDARLREQIEMREGIKRSFAMQKLLLRQVKSKGYNAGGIYIFEVKTACSCGDETVRLRVGVELASRIDSLVKQGLDLMDLIRQAGVQAEFDDWGDDWEVKLDLQKAEAYLQKFEAERQRGKNEEKFDLEEFKTGMAERTSILNKLLSKKAVSDGFVAERNFIFRVRDDNSDFDESVYLSVGEEMAQRISTLSDQGLDLMELIQRTATKVIENDEEWVVHLDLGLAKRYSDKFEAEKKAQQTSACAQEAQEEYQAFVCPGFSQVLEKLEMEAEEGGIQNEPAENEERAKGAKITLDNGTEVFCPFNNFPPSAERATIVIPQENICGIMREFAPYFVLSAGKGEIARVYADNLSAQIESGRFDGLFTHEEIFAWLKGHSVDVKFTGIERAIVDRTSLPSYGVKLREPVAKKLAGRPEEGGDKATEIIKLTHFRPSVVLSEIDSFMRNVALGETMSFSVNRDTIRGIRLFCNHKGWQFYTEENPNSETGGMDIILVVTKGKTLGDIVDSRWDDAFLV